jgi:HK97 family phage major capsid protein
MGYAPRHAGAVFNRAAAPAVPDGVAVPKNSDELAEMMGDSAWLEKVMASRSGLHSVMAAYGEKQQGDGTEIRAQVKEMAQQEVRNWLLENGAKGDGPDAKRLNLDPQAKRGNGNMLTSHRQGTAHNPGAPGACLDAHFDTNIDYIRAIWHKSPEASVAEQRGVLRNAASSVSPSDGGFLVPETLRSQLLQIALEQSVVRPLATVVPMDSARVPFPMIDATSNASSVFGGMIAYWGEEGATFTDASPKFGRAELDAKKLTGLSAVPNELLQDSIVSFSALIENLWPKALAFEEDSKFMTGTGVGEPLGFIGAANSASIAVAAESGQASASIVYENIVHMYARMLPASLQNAVWICSPDALPELLTMALSVGTGGNSVYVVNAQGPAPQNIFGRPLIVSEKASTLGARGDICFVDLSYYLVGDRQTMTADSSTDYNFGSDKTTFRIIQRVDGRPWLKSAITPKNGSSNTLSPFVELAARP